MILKKSKNLQEHYIHLELQVIDTFELFNSTAHDNKGKGKSIILTSERKHTALSNYPHFHFVVTKLIVE